MDVLIIAFLTKCVTITSIFIVFGIISRSGGDRGLRTGHEHDGGIYHAVSVLFRLSSVRLKIV